MVIANPVRTRSRPNIVAALVMAAALAVGGLAGCGSTGGTVSVQGTGSNVRLVFVAASGKDNVVTVTPVATAGTDVFVDDDADTISPGNGCVAVDADTARCTGVRFVTLDLGDGHDTATNATALPSKINESSSAGIRGGPGDDGRRFPVTRPHLLWSSDRKGGGAVPQGQSPETASWKAASSRAMSGPAGW